MRYKSWNFKVLNKKYLSLKKGEDTHKKNGTDNLKEESMRLKEVSSFSCAFVPVYRCAMWNRKKYKHGTMAVFTLYQTRKAGYACAMWNRTQCKHGTMAVFTLCRIRKDDPVLKLSSPATQFTSLLSRPPIPGILWASPRASGGSSKTITSVIYQCGYCF